MFANTRLAAPLSDQCLSFLESLPLDFLSQESCFPPPPDCDRSQRGIDAMLSIKSFGGKPELVRKALLADAPKNASLFEQRSIASLQTDEFKISMTQVIANVKEWFPSQAAKKYPEVAALRNRCLKRLHWLKERMMLDATAWAEKILRENHPLAISLITSPLSDDLIEEGLEDLVAPPRAYSAKKAERQANKMLFGFYSSADAVQKSILKAECIGDTDQCTIIAADLVCGGLRVLMRHVLARHFFRLVMYTLSVENGVNSQDLREVIDFRNADFLAAVKAFPPVAEEHELGHIIDLLEVATAAETIASMKLETMEGLRALAQGVAQSDEEHAEELRKKSKEILAGNRTIKEQEKTIARLRSAITDNEHVRRLSAEIAALKAQNAELKARVVSAPKVEAKSRKGELQVKASQATPIQPETKSPKTGTTESVPDLTTEECLGRLQKKKGVVIGGHERFINKIKALLPGWSFFSADYKKADEALLIGAEMAVIFSGYCNHCLTETSLRLLKLHQIPLCYASKVNPTAFVREVAISVG